jgi:hypothetical protein
LGATRRQQLFEVVPRKAPVDLDREARITSGRSTSGHSPQYCVRVRRELDLDCHLSAGRYLMTDATTDLFNLCEKGVPATIQHLDTANAASDLPGGSVRPLVD